MKTVFLGYEETLFPTPFLMKVIDDWKFANQIPIHCDVFRFIMRCMNAKVSVVLSVESKDIITLCSHMIQNCFDKAGITRNGFYKTIGINLPPNPKVICAQEDDWAQIKSQKNPLNTFYIDTDLDRVIAVHDLNLGIRSYQLCRGHTPGDFGKPLEGLDDPRIVEEIFNSPERKRTEEKPPF